jgi:hypothetical protein
MTGSSGVSSTRRLIGSIIDVSGILDHPLSRVMTDRILFSNSTGSRASKPSLRAIAKQSMQQQERVDCFVASRLAMTATHNFAISLRVSREVWPARSALRSEGAGNAGRPMRPIAACAMGVVERTRVSQVTPESPGIPRAMVYGLFRALPGDRAFLPPSPALLSANLTPASGCQDHTTSPSASAPFVKGAACVHRIPPHVRDDRETPLCWDGMI